VIAAVGSGLVLGVVAVVLARQLSGTVRRAGEAR
jgi:hypothetical protein